MPGKWKYDNFDDACRASPSNKAIGFIRIEHEGKRIDAELIKPIRGNGVIVYKDHPGIPIRPATSREVDSIRRWDDF